MMPIPNSDAWLHAIATRLQSDSFVPLDPQSYQPAGFKFAVRRTRFEIAKFGMAETFFVFADIPMLTPEIMNSFSNGAFQLALRSKSVPLPCGLFESVWSFAVAITRTCTRRWLKSYEIQRRQNTGQPERFQSSLTLRQDTFAILKRRPCGARRITRDSVIRFIDIWDNDQRV